MCYWRPNIRRKPNQTWIHKGSEFYIRSMKSLQDNYIEMHSTYNEGKSLAAEIFIRTLKNEIYRHMTSILTNVYIDELPDIVNKYNNIYDNTIKIKSFDVNSSSCIDSNIKDNNKDS